MGLKHWLSRIAGITTDSAARHPTASMQVKPESKAVAEKEDADVNIEHLLQNALQRDDYKQAAKIAADFQGRHTEKKAPGAEALFPSHWSEKELYNLLNLLKEAKNKPPACLRALSPAARESLYEAFTWAFLWNEKIQKSERIKCLDLGPGIKTKSAAQALMSWIQSKLSLIGMREAQEAGVKIKVGIDPPGDCSIACRHKAKWYALDSVPEIPMEGCQRKPCCGCVYTTKTR